MIIDYNIKKQLALLNGKSKSFLLITKI